VVGCLVRGAALSAGSLIAVLPSDEMPGRGSILNRLRLWSMRTGPTIAPQMASRNTVASPRKSKSVGAR
jgi:hypothetical protein